METSFTESQFYVWKIDSKMNAYYQIFADAPETDYEDVVNWLTKELGIGLTGAYEDMFENAEIVHFNDNDRRSYTFFFDCCDNADDNCDKREARVVFVCGRSTKALEPRNHTRMRSFLGSFKDIPGLSAYDKGHFIAHCNAGQLDQNLYPQLKELNRGISPQGKLFRSMERYLQKNEGVFFLCDRFITT